MLNDRGFDPVLLRCFLAVADTLHFTAAAVRLGVGQSTVSQQVGRLEQAVGRTLLVRSARRVALTGDGEAMVGLARDILAAQDRAVGYFDRSVTRGRLRFGVSEDLVLSRLPDILRRFREENPAVELELEVGLSSRLYERLDGDGLDLVFAKRLPGDGRGQTVWRERLVWLGCEGWRRQAGQALPLVLFPGTSITRRAAIETLNREGEAWTLSASSPSLSALTAAVGAGFGITAQSPLLEGSGLSILGEREALPLLPMVEFVVLARHDRPGPAAQALIAVIQHNADLLGARRASATSGGG
jgi:DNA-binding transcriptional LysR family regulator